MTGINSGINEILSRLEPSIGELDVEVVRYFAQVQSEKAELNATFTSFRKKVHEIEIGGSRRSVNETIAEKNHELIKLQEQMKELVMQGVHGPRVVDLERRASSVSESIKNLRFESQSSGQPHSALLVRGIIESGQSLVDGTNRIGSLNAELCQAVESSMSTIWSIKESRDKTKEKEKSEAEAKSGILTKLSRKVISTEDKDDEVVNMEDRLVISLLDSVSPLVSFSVEQLERRDRTAQWMAKQPEDSKEEPVHKRYDSLKASVDSLKEASSNEKTIIGHIAQIKEATDAAESLANALASQIESFRRTAIGGIGRARALIEVTKYEVDPKVFRVPSIRCLDDAMTKLMVVSHALRDSLVYCLVATPLVYLTDSSFSMSNHADFRVKLRDILHQNETKVQRMQDDQHLVTEDCRKSTLLLGDAIVQVLNVKLPAMTEVYEDDYSLVRKNWSAQRKTLRDDLASYLSKLGTSSSPPNSSSSSKRPVSSASINESICAAVHAMTFTLLQYWTFKPLGRPHLYLSDSVWQLVPEADVRHQARVALLL